MKAKTEAAQDKEQIKSRDRVVQKGEVFTNKREVDAMLDLVKEETDRIDSRFLEPACGDGNFLAEILRKKLDSVTMKCRTSQASWELGGAVAISSIYGVEIQEDNTEECRERLFDVFNEEYYSRLFRSSTNEKYLSVIRFFLDTNIICGDALSLLDKNGNPLTFAEWGFIKEKVQRRDFKLAGLLNESKDAYASAVTKEQRDSGMVSLFDDAPEEDFENAGLVKENVYPLINYMELGGSR
jgi:hypothetical protein